MADDSAAKTASAPADAPPTERREFSELKREVVEARNLVIKSDNQLKNVYAEVKRMGERQEEFGRRRFYSSATAYILFALLAGMGAFSVARTESSREREQAASADARARELQQKLEVVQRSEQTRRDGGERALKVFEQLVSEKEGPGLSQAMSNALKLDRSQLSPLEAKAIEEKVATLKSQVAQGALDRGLSAVRRGDHRSVSIELGRYLDLVGSSNDPQVYYQLGFARSQLKEFAGSVEPLERFLKLQPQGRLAQLAGFLLGVASEETGATGRAAEAYARAAALFPSTELASQIRARLRKLPPAALAQGAAPSRPAVAPAPPPAQPAATGTAPAQKPR